MLVPAKHISFSESILGLGSLIISMLQKPKTIDELWSQYQKDIQDSKSFHIHSFDNMMLAIIFLFSINKINENEGKLELI